MKKNLFLGTIIFLLLVAPAYADDEDAELVDDITGYGEIQLGDRVSLYDTWEGVDMPSLPWLDYYALEGDQTITIGHRGFECFISFFTYDGKIENIFIGVDFPLSMDLDEISDLIFSFQKVYTNKYDIDNMTYYDYWVWEYDSDYDDWWNGWFTLQDDVDNGNDAIMFKWDDYNLTIQYRSALYEEMLTENMEESSEEQEDRI